MKQGTQPGVSWRFVLVLLLTAMLAHLSACSNAPHLPPSFILINVDTLRADYLGCYGFEGDVSPNIDALASEAFRFDNSFVQSPWTKPSVASLFTSLYPQVHQLTNHEGRYWGETTGQMKTGVLAGEAVTLAEVLQAQGYETAAFVSNPWLVSTYGFAQGFDFYDDHIVGLAIPADRLTSNARAWIETRSGNAPFFLYIHLMDVHAPYAYYAPREDFDSLAGQNRREERVLSEQEVPYKRWNNIEKKPQWATEEMRHTLSYWKTRYASGVRAMDRRLGPFFDFLRRRETLDRAYFLLTSDHGEELFEHGDWSHGQNLYDHQLRIPLLIRPPGGLREAGRVEDIVESVDVMPTILALAGAPAESRAQGRDVSSVFEGTTDPGEAATYATATQRHPGLYSIRTRNHKLLFGLDTGELQLYDLARDPAEQLNLGGSQPEITERLRNQLLAHIAESTAEGTLEAEPAPIPQDILDKLRSLGYVN